jgi:ammonia channel protein AmtB
MQAFCLASVCPSLATLCVRPGVQLGLGLRVDGQDERTGLDSALHGERAFEIE